MSNFLTEKYTKLAPYVPGEQPKDKKYIKLNTNESPFPPSPLAVKLANDEAKNLMLYSDPDSRDLIKEIALYYGVNTNQVIVTNGSDEVLNFAFMAYCDSKTPAIFADITYGFYKVFADVNNLPFKEIPLKQDFTIDVNDYIKEDGTVFIANPNAPTGIKLQLTEIEKLLQSNPNRIVVIDEAYADFSGESMAGARLGFGIANAKIIEDLNKIRYSTNPYNVNRMTASAGIGAIKDKEYFASNVEKIIKAREYTQKELTNLGFSLTDSKANFVFTKTEKIDGETLYLKLKEKGVLVRHFSKPRIKDYIRVTVGSIEEMQTFIEKVKEILEK